MKDILKKLYLKSRHLVPERAIYSSKYFELRAALLSGSSTVIDLCRREQLRKILVTAVEHVDFYKSLNLCIKDIQNVDPILMLEEFPYIEKDMLMDEPARFINNKSFLTLSTYATSGGSSGRGVGIWRSKSSSDIERLFFDLRWGRVGYTSERARVLRIGADARRGLTEDPVSQFGRKVMLSPYHISKAHITKIKSGLEKHSFDFIHAYPSSLLELTRLLRECSCHPYKVGGIFLASEPVSIDQLNYLYSYWQCPLIAHYGLAERTNLGFYFYQSGDESVTYELERLYSISANYPGTNEIVGTSLWNETMPLIKYRTKDNGRLVDGKIISLEGREQDFLIDKSGNKIPGLSVVIDEPTWSQVRQYQVRQTEQGKIEILVVPRYDSLSDNFKSYILNQQLSRWGGFFDISILVVDSIPLTPAGKSRLVDVRIH